MQNLRELLETRARDHRSKPFLLSEIDGREWTYDQFDSAVNRTANMLIENGIEKGDVVSLLMPNSAEYVIAYFACWKIGAMAGPVNSLLKPEETEWILKNSESKLLLGSSQFLETIENIEKPPLIEFDNVEAATEGFSKNLPNQDLSSED